MPWDPIGIERTTSSLPAKVLNRLAAQLNDPSTVIGSVINSVYARAIQRSNHVGTIAPSDITGVTATGSAVMTATTTTNARNAIGAADATDVAARLRPRGAWAVGVSYLANDLVTSSGGTYYALISHTSANPAPTATSIYWQAVGSTSTATTFVPSYANAQAGALFVVPAPFPASRPSTRTDIGFLLRSNSTVATPTWLIDPVDTHIVVG